MATITENPYRREFRPELEHARHATTGTHISDAIKTMIETKSKK